MSIFSNPAANFSTVAFVLEDGEVNLKIVAVKAKKIDRDDGTTGGIISLNLRVADGEFAGKMVSTQDCWYDDDGQNTQAMRWVLAALGIKPGTKEADDQFRAQFADLDIGFDEDSLKPHDGWNRVLNSVVSCSVRKFWNDKRKEPAFENKFFNLRPYGV